MSNTEVNLKVPKSYVGTCIRWDIDRGFGFLKSSSPQRTIFIHRSNVVPDAEGFQDLQAGEKVRYFIGFYNQRPQAVEVLRITDEEFVSNGDKL